MSEDLPTEVQQGMTSLLNRLPHTVSPDLDAVRVFTEGLVELLAQTVHDVYISAARLELVNASGYVIGELIHDGEQTAFVAHDDRDLTERN